MRLYELTEQFLALQELAYDPEVDDAIDYSKEVNQKYADAKKVIIGKYDIMGGFYLPVWSEVSAELPDMNVAFTEMITGERDIEEFDALVQEWKDAGGQAALDEAQQIYDERLK